MTTKIAYFVHDLTDAAVARRVRMLTAGGAAVTPIGFRRGTRRVAVIEDAAALEIGRSADGVLLRRVFSVAAAVGKLGVVAPHVRGAQVIMARNLEMLFIAARARKRYAPAASLVYECLDIHRLLLSGGIDGAFLRFLESKLWRDVDLLLTSSPAFIRNYFTPRGFPAPIRLVENKPLMLDDDRPDVPPPKRQPGPPWRIGWFGVIRCRTSLDILSALAAAAAGAVEIVIRGRPSGSSFSDFAAAVANRPHLRYAGPYRNPDDLPSIYGDVHFTWAIDYYERGQNSAWLLPNRLYEGGAYGSVPMALAGVETGAWLAQHGAGVVLNEPIAAHLADFFRHLDRRQYEELANAVRALPRSALVSTRNDCRELVRGLCPPFAGNVAADLRRRAQDVALGSPGAPR